MRTKKEQAEFVYFVGNLGLVVVRKTSIGNYQYDYAWEDRKEKCLSCGAPIIRTSTGYTWSDPKELGWTYLGRL